MITERAQSLQKALLGRDNAHIGGDGLDDDAGDLPAVGVKELAHACKVVILRDERLCSIPARDAEAVRHRARQAPRARFDEQAVRMPVIVARKFDDLLPPSIAACDAHGGHGRLRARVDEADKLHVRAGGANLLGELRLPARGRTVGKASCCGVRDRADDLLARMP